MHTTPDRWRPGQRGCRSLTCPASLSTLPARAGDGSPRELARLPGHARGSRPEECSLRRHAGQAGEVAPGWQDKARYVVSGAAGCVAIEASTVQLFTVGLLGQGFTVIVVLCIAGYYSHTPWTAMAVASPAAKRPRLEGPAAVAPAVTPPSAASAVVGPGKCATCPIGQGALVPPHGPPPLAPGCPLSARTCTRHLGMSRSNRTATAGRTARPACPARIPSGGAEVKPLGIVSLPTTLPWMARCSRVHSTWTLPCLVPWT